MILTVLKEAIAAHQSGKLIEAEQQYKDILEANPQDADALNAYGILLLQTDRLDQAEKNFETIVELKPEEARYRMNLANVHLAQGLHARALEGFEQANKLAPDNPETLYNVATCRMVCADAAGAEEAFGQALALNGDHGGSLHNLGSLYAKQNRLTDALPLLQKACDLSVVASETATGLASVLERLNRLEEGLAVLHDDLPATDPMVMIMRARLWRRLGRIDEALALMKSAPAPDVESNHEIAGDWHHELGLCADRAGQADVAFQAFSDAKSCWRHKDKGNLAPDFLNKVRSLRQSKETPSQADQASSYQNQLIVFAGFPRSGTTLLEAMLGAHPDVRTTSEANLIEPALVSARQNPSRPAVDCYFELLSQGPVGAPRENETIVDKLPLNIVHAGEIAAQMPDARLLIALRDPRDVVLSCLMQRFRRNAAMQNFDNLEDTVRLYEEVMGLWLEQRQSLTIP